MSQSLAGGQSVQSVDPWMADPGGKQLGHPSVMHHPSRRSDEFRFMTTMISHIAYGKKNSNSAVKSLPRLKHLVLQLFSGNHWQQFLYLFSEILGVLTSVYMYIF